MHRLDFSLYSDPKEFWGMEPEPVLTPREKSLYWRLRGGLNPRHSITLDSKPNTLLTELFQPLIVFQ